MFQALSSFECESAYNDIINLYQEMKSNELLHVNRSIYQIVMRVCGKNKDLNLLKQIHCDMKNNSEYCKGIGILCELIEMYIKCGDVETAKCIFNGIEESDLEKLPKEFLDEFIE